MKNLKTKKTIEVIPAVIAKNFPELRKRLEMVGPYVNWVQLDIMDGRFVPFKTWNEPEDLKRLKVPLKIEVHLMISSPFQVVDDWLGAGVSRIIVHWESLRPNPAKQLKNIIQKTKKRGIQIGAAFNPETPWQKIEPFLKTPVLDLILLMGVTPGKAGQGLQRSVLEKARSLKEKYPQTVLGVDGGVKLTNIREINKAGASILVIGSAIFKAKNIKETIEKFKAIYKYGK